MLMNEVFSLCFNILFDLSDLMSFIFVVYAFLYVAFCSFSMIDYFYL